MSIPMEMTPEQVWMEEMVANALTMRSDIIKAMMNPDRDVAKECKHPVVITLEDYFQMYERNDIAGRVNDIWAQKCWDRCPILFQDDDPEKTTPWELEFENLAKGLRGNSKFVDDRQEGNPIWKALRQLDIESGIGHFGGLLMGLDDKTSLESPVSSFNPQGHSKKIRNLTFLRVLSEKYLEIAEVEENSGSPRYKLPKMYKAKLSDDSDTQTNIHWHRILHLAEGDGVCASPRMECVWDRLLDLKKLLGGSAEMYWRGAFPGMTFETHSDAGGDVDIDEAKMKGQIHSYMERLQRAMLLVGLTAKSHAPQVVDPKPQVDVQLEGICIRINTPKRIFLGSERGELSSTQDTDNFNISVEGRRRNHCTGSIIVPFVDRQTHLGTLSSPEMYKLEWPSLNVMTDEAAASVAVKRTQAMQMYVTGGIRALIEPVTWGHRVLGMPLAQARDSFKNADSELKKFEQRLVKALKPVKTGGMSGGAKDMTKRGERKKAGSKV